MVPAVPEWRYGRSGEQMPWYPTVRLLRQSTHGEWGPVMQRIVADLGELAANRQQR